MRIPLFLDVPSHLLIFQHQIHLHSNGEHPDQSAEAVLKKALRYRPYWKDNGGITVSGGEPLLQIDFLIELFTLAKKEGVHTTLDTCGQPF